MFKRTIQDLRQNIIDSNGIGENLYDKNEFNYLTKKMFDDEILDSAIVCQIEGEIYLVAFTDKRIFFIKKEGLLPSEIKRRGLEEIRDIELKDTNGYAELLFVYFDGTKQRIESISLEKAKKFGKQIINRIQTWNSKY